ncbi:hypothetical protein [Actinomadura montaniterrae]|uniref:Uncharacterized protein n=1 Tax=Actinomadura montaniterrae TaxID=1803903 RepID=A0A6L3VZ00_9ACTN|nr:hypothetical protein [Actinomadura montaniterrae]KAB2379246.1 hypothetical protein F9B16_21260 [Actinomadura montaniterrae]
MTALLSPNEGRTDQVRRAADTPHWTDPAADHFRRQTSTPGFPVDVTEIVLPAGQPRLSVVRDTPLAAGRAFAAAAVGARHDACGMQEQCGGLLGCGVGDLG